MIRNRLRDERGFTLLELMIVVLIISFIVAVYVYAVPFFQGKARDGRRYDSLDQMRHVIELYHVDFNAYPATLVGAGIYNTYSTDSDNYTASLTNLLVSNTYIPSVVPQYYESLPQEPNPGNSTVPGCAALGYKRTFLYFSNGDNYKLVSQCASENNDYSPDNFYYDPGRPTWGWATSNNMDYTTFTLGW